MCEHQSVTLGLISIDSPAESNCIVYVFRLVIIAFCDANEDQRFLDLKFLCRVLGDDLRHVSHSIIACPVAADAIFESGVSIDQRRLDLISDVLVVDTMSMNHMRYQKPGR